MKNNLSYYRHEVTSHNHWKFKTLRRKYKWCGEGKFWALNNMIGESEGCKLDISNPDKKAAIAVDLDFDDAEFDEYLAFLIEKCRLVVLTEGYLTTPMTQENLAEVNNTRERKRNWKKQNSTPIPEKETSTSSNYPSTGSLVDSKNIKSTVESKVNKSKEEESKVKGFPTHPIPSDMNGLPEIKIGGVIELIWHTKNLKITNDKVLGLWNVFKIQNLTGKKFYASESDVQSHFINWIKKQDFEKIQTIINKSNPVEDDARRILNAVNKK